MTVDERLALAIREIGELEVYVSLFREGVATGQTAVEFVDLRRKSHAALSWPDPYGSEGDYQEALKRAEELEGVARKEATAGFPYLHGLASLRLWSLLETAVGDVATELLTDKAVWRQSEAIAKLRGPVIEFAAAPVERQAEFLVEQLKSNTHSSLKPGVGRFEALLGALGIGGPVDDDVRRILFELSEVRNLLSHRAGEVDTQFEERCPWLKLKRGHKLLISGADFSIYRAAVVWYLLEIARREEQFRMVERKDDNKLEELQLKCLQAITDARRSRSAES